MYLSDRLETLIQSPAAILGQMSPNTATTAANDDKCFETVLSPLNEIYKEAASDSPCPGSPFAYSNELMSFYDKEGFVTSPMRLFSCNKNQVDQFPNKEIFSLEDIEAQFPKNSRLTLVQHKNSTDECIYEETSTDGSLTSRSTGSTTSSCGTTSRRRTGSFKSDTISSRSKRSTPKEMKEDYRFKIKSELHGEIVDKRTENSLVQKKLKRVARIQQAKDFSTKLNRYSARYFSKRDRDLDLDVVAVIEEKIASVIRGYIVRRRIEKQKQACIKIQRWYRDFVPVRRNFLKHWKNEQDRRQLLYIATQNSLRTFTPQKQFEQSLENIQIVQNKIRTLLQQEKVKIERIELMVHVDNIMNGLSTIQQHSILKNDIALIKLIQKNIRESMVKRKKKRHLVKKSLNGCSIM